MITRGSLVRAQPDPPQNCAKRLLCRCCSKKSTGFASDFYPIKSLKSRVVLLSGCAWGFSSAGRAPALQAGGRRFDPVNLHQVQTQVKCVCVEQNRRAISGMRFRFGLERSEAVSFFNNLEEVKIVIIFVNSGAGRDIGE